MNLTNHPREAMRFFGFKAAATAIADFSDQPLGPITGDQFTIESEFDAHGGLNGYYVVRVRDAYGFTRGLFKQEA